MIVKVLVTPLPFLPALENHLFQTSCNIVTETFDKEWFSQKVNATRITQLFSSDFLKIHVQLF